MSDLPRNGPPSWFTMPPQVHNFLETRSRDLSNPVDAHGLSDPVPLMIEIQNSHIIPAYAALCPSSCPGFLQQLDTFQDVP